MAVKLHRCSATWFKSERSHACWRVEKALEDMGIEYERVTMLGLPRSRRKHVIGLTGQDRFPVIEFEDGSVYREESKDMAARVRAGSLFEGRGGRAAAAAPAASASAEAAPAEEHSHEHEHGPEHSHEHEEEQGHEH
jgi:hypothetical protein